MFLLLRFSIEKVRLKLLFNSKREREIPLGVCVRKSVAAPGPMPATKRPDRSPARRGRGDVAADETGPSGVRTARRSSLVSAPTTKLQELKDQGREPCYLAARVWGVNSMDIKAQKATVVFRIHMIFRPTAKALTYLPAGTTRINSDQEGASAAACLFALLFRRGLRR